MSVMAFDRDAARRAARLARSVPHLPPAAAAEATRLGVDALRELWGEFPARGRCAAMLAEAAAAGSATAAALDVCPPFARSPVSHPHRRAPRSTLSCNAASPDPAPSVTAAQHPGCPPLTLIALTDGPGAGSDHVAYHPGCPPAALHVSARSPKSELAAAALAHPGCPPSVVSQAATSTRSSARSAAGQNPNLRLHLRRELLNDEDVYVAAYASSYPLTSQATLERFARSDSSVLRQAAAAHPNTPPQTLGVLTHETVDVGTTAAANPNCPPQRLDVLAGDSSLGMRNAVAQNPACPPEILATLAADPEVWVRQYVAANPNCAPEVLATLATDPKTWVREHVAANPNCAPEVLAELTQDNASEVRAKTARQPRTPLAALCRLVAESDSGISDAALETFAAAAGRTG